MGWREPAGSVRHRGYAGTDWRPAPGGEPRSFAAGQEALSRRADQDGAGAGDVEGAGAHRAVEEGDPAYKRGPGRAETAGPRRHPQGEGAGDRTRGAGYPEGECDGVAAPG